MGNPLTQPDPGLFIWTILTFLVLTGLLARFAWRPLLQALEKRSQMIAKAIDDAAQAKADLEQVQKESAKILAAARVDAEAIVARTRTDAEHLREELRQKASADAAAILQKAEREIQFETSRAVEQVRKEAVELSVAIASKLLRRAISKDDNKALIEDTLKQIETIKH